MKVHYKHKKIIAIGVACMLITVAFASCNNTESEIKTNKEKVKTGSEMVLVSDKETGTVDVTELAKESDSNDLVIKSDSDKESAVKTKAEESKKTVETKPDNTIIKPGSKPAIKPDVKPGNKPESKPEQKPEKKKVWVVDQEAIPAWDEVVDDHDFPTGYDREYYWIEGSGISEKYYSGKEVNKRLDELADKGIAVAWGNGSEFVQTGYMKKTIHHPAVPEKGHWEWK